MLRSQSGRPKTAKERGAILKALLKERDLTQETFADATKNFDPEGKGLSYHTINRLCNGVVVAPKTTGGQPYQYDLLNVYEETASIIILTLDSFKPITDTEIQEFLGLDTDPVARTVWVTKRPWPQGVGAVEQKENTFNEKLKVTLRSPMGDLVVPAGAVIVVDPLGTGGYQLYRMADGGIYAVNTGAVRVEGQFLGRLKQVLFE